MTNVPNLLRNVPKKRTHTGRGNALNLAAKVVRFWSMRGNKKPCFRSASRVGKSRFGNQFRFAPPAMLSACAYWRKHTRRRDERSRGFAGGKWLGQFCSSMPGGQCGQ